MCCVTRLRYLAPAKERKAPQRANKIDFSEEAIKPDDIVDQAVEWAGATAV